jgi:hypothetical protein
MEPLAAKLAPDTWHYAKRCLLALAEQLAKRMITLTVRGSRGGRANVRGEGGGHGRDQLAQCMVTLTVRGLGAGAWGRGGGGGGGQ